MTAAPIDRDGREPGRETARSTFGAQLASFAPGHQKDFLQEVIDIFRPAKQAVGELRDPLAVNRDNTVKGGAVAFNEPGNQGHVFVINQNTYLFLPLPSRGD